MNGFSDLCCSLLVWRLADRAEPDLQNQKERRAIHCKEWNEVCQWSRAVTLVPAMGCHSFGSTSSENLILRNAPLTVSHFPRTFRPLLAYTLQAFLRGDEATRGDKQFAGFPFRKQQHLSRITFSLLFKIMNKSVKAPEQENYRTSISKHKLLS
jgi:hypothetical protein